MAYDQAAIPRGPGTVSLDRTPPPPPLRKKPGDDTQSLLGGANVNPPGVGASMATPMGRALAGVQRLMEGANLVESVVPGSIPPPVIMIITSLMEQIPEAVRQMQMMQGMGGAGMMGDVLGAQGGMGMGSPAAAMGMAASLPPGAGAGPGPGPMMGGGRPPL